MTVLSLEEKVGLMCIVGTSLPEADSELIERFTKFTYGGMGVFPHNIFGEAQMKRLMEDLKQFAKSRPKSEAPFMISIDEEGGSLSNFSEFFPTIPGNRAIGLANDPHLAYLSGRLVGSQLHELGFMLNWAPVLDVNSNPLNPVIGVRSFGEDPVQVARYGVAFVQGMKESGVMATVKHFPGHGDVATDSHVALPICDLTIKQLVDCSLHPFQAVIEAGVGAVMVAHILFPNIPESNGLPSSLSTFFIEELLRGKLGYDGLVCTDDIEMHAIKHNFEPEDVGVLAVLAGNDQILMCHTPDFQQRVYQGILHAVRTGVITEHRIDVSVRRILFFQERMKQCREQANVIPRAEWESIAAHIAGASIVVHRDPSRQLPLSKQAYVMVVPRMQRLTKADTTFDKPFMLESYLLAKGVQLETIYTSMDPTEDERMEVEQKIRNADAVIQVTRNAHMFQGQLAVARHCADSKPHICVVLRNPYDAEYLPDQSTVVLICSSSNESMQAFAHTCTKNKNY
ncbi:beta-glucosidase [Paenibacillus marchantiophytorum]|uniref:beta-N-acetylhexosaminidase n=1 Tax=Paenibacillus marchantiophytorum TaxID=1619310 RepID=A0ABQ1EQM4_9BACL|nr:glycoside hydrolase family 3 protein [Paenibacillus marchantiophytorum]GFZ82777.1 beta-glucosidase [Paenibacillus marchantiophytorum]